MDSEQSAEPVVVGVRFVEPDTACLENGDFEFLTKLTRVFVRFDHTPERELLLFSFHPEEVCPKFVADEFFGKTKKQIDDIRSARIMCTVGPPEVFPEYRDTALSHPISAQETDIATISQAEILGYIDLENGHVIQRNTTHVLRVEFLQVRGCKLSLYDFCPDHFRPKLEANEFVGLSLRGAVALLEKRRVT